MQEEIGVRFDAVILEIDDEGNGVSESTSTQTERDRDPEAGA